MSDIAYVVRIS